LSKTPGSPVSTGSPRKFATKNRNQPLVPTTIRQLLNSEQINPEYDDFVMNGQTINQVSVVALILNTNPQATNLNYLVDDGTGQIDVRIYINQEEPNEYIQQKSVEWLEGCYVRVIGNLRAFGTKRSLVALRLILIEDFNEITYHFLECVYAHILSSRDSTVQPTIATHPVAVYPQKQQQNRPPPQKNNRAPATNSNTNTNTLQQQQSVPYNDSFSPLQNAIIQCIISGHPQKGVSADEICEQLSHMAEENDVRNDITWLADEGHLFTTIDDYYALTGDEI